MSDQFISSIQSFQESLPPVSAVRLLSGKEKEREDELFSRLQIEEGPDYTVALSLEAQSKMPVVLEGEQSESEPRQERHAGYGSGVTGRLFFDSELSMGNLAVIHAGTMGVLTNLGDASIAASTPQGRESLFEPGGQAGRNDTVRPSGGDEERTLSRAFMGGSEGTSFSAGQPDEDRDGSGPAAGDEEGRQQGTGKSLSEEEWSQVEELKESDREVRVHEQAHMGTGTGLAGGVSYRTAIGSGGGNYAVSGEAQIDFSASSNPSIIESRARKGRTEALAPLEPLNQKHHVAAQMEAAARMEKVVESREWAGISTVVQGMVGQADSTEYPGLLQKAVRAYGGGSGTFASASPGRVISLVA